MAERRSGIQTTKAPIQRSVLGPILASMQTSKNKPSPPSTPPNGRRIGAQANAAPIKGSVLGPIIFASLQASKAEKKLTPPATPPNNNIEPNSPRSNPNRTRRTPSAETLTILAEGTHTNPAVVVEHDNVSPRQGAQARRRRLSRMGTSSSDLISSTENSKENSPRVSIEETSPRQSLAVEKFGIAKAKLLTKNRSARAFRMSFATGKIQDYSENIQSKYL